MAIRDEVEEFKVVEPTDTDIEQAKSLAIALSTASVACGVYIPTALEPLIEKVLARAIRDAKDGVKTPDKLIIKRLINHYRTLKTQSK